LLFRKKTISAPPGTVDIVGYHWISGLAVTMQENKQLTYAPAAQGHASRLSPFNLPSPFGGRPLTFKKIRRKAIL
jgi:hypothetical protein